MAFTPVPTRKCHAGWTVEKQLQFIDLLSTFGSVRQAAHAVGMSESSAYRLRARPDCESFHKAWDLALQNAATRLLAVAVDRALHGSPRDYWKDGKLVGTVVTRSDKLLMWAVERLKPRHQSTAHQATPETVFKSLTGFRNQDLRIDTPIDEEIRPEPHPPELEDQCPSRMRTNPHGVSRVSRPARDPPIPLPDRKRLPA